jgi:hypothetical protein
MDERQRPFKGDEMKERALWGALGLVMLASSCTVAVAPGPGPVGPPPPEPAVVVSEGTVYPTVPPPDPIPEYRPVAPGYNYAWVNGYWDWTGYDWSWYSGYWVPQAEFAFYVGPRFVFVDGRPTYYRGYWRGEGGRRTYGYGYRGSPPPVAYQARPQAQPNAWRAQHNEGWRAQPGAGTWRAQPAPVRAAAPGRGFEEQRAEQRRMDEQRAEQHRMDERRMEEHHAEPGRAEPGHPGGFRPGPGQPGGPPAAHPFPGGPGAPPHAGGPPAPAPNRRPPSAPAPAPAPSHGNRKK